MTIGYDNLAINYQILLDLPFREGTGAITRDVAKPHHQDVDLINAPTWESLVSGLGIIDLNGTDEYLQLLAAACDDLDFTSEDYSIGGWFYIESGGDDDKTLISRFFVSANGWEMYHYAPTLTLQMRHHHATGASTRTSAYSENWAFGEWYFMGFSRIGAVGQFYRGDINGFSALTTTCNGGLENPETCAKNLIIGANTGGVTNHYNGKLWRPRIWGRALQASEWAQIFEIERHWFGV